MAKKTTLVFLSVILLGIVATIPVYAQTVNRSYYVRVDGDDGNNGRSEDAPLKTLTKAVELASKGAVKTITVLGTLSDYQERERLINAGTVEILITDKEGETAVLTKTELRIGKGGSFRFENITINRSLTNSDSYGAGKGAGISISGATVTFGKGCVITGNSSYGIEVDDGASLTLTDNAIVTKNGQSGIRLSKGTVMMLGNSVVSENGDEENFTRYSNDFYGGGVYNGGTLVMRDNSKIVGNIARRGGGVYVYDRCDYSDGLPPSITMEGNAMIANNTAKENGGGIWISYQTRLDKRDTSHKDPLLFTGKTVISGNKAKMGGGIYINSGISIYPFSLTGGRISENTAEYGAGVYFEGKSPKGYWTVPEPSSESLVLKGTTIEKNTAELVGGGLYVKTDAKYVHQSGTVSGNTAGDGEGEDIFKQK
jgi:hypothetical protein